MPGCTRPELEKPRCTRFGRSGSAQGRTRFFSILLPCAAACARLVRPFALELVQTRGSWACEVWGGSEMPESQGHDFRVAQGRHKAKPRQTNPLHKVPAEAKYISHSCTRRRTRRCTRRCTRINEYPPTWCAQGRCTRCTRIFFLYFIVIVYICS